MTSRFAMVAAAAAAVVIFLASGCGGSDSAGKTVVTETVTVAAEAETENAEPSPTTDETTTSGSPRPMIVRDSEGAEIGVFTISNIYRTGSVEEDLGPVNGDFLVVEGEYENTTANTPTTAYDILHVGTKPVPCESGLSCDEGEWDFGNEFQTGVVGGSSEADSLAGEVITVAYYVDLNPGSVRRSERIQTLDDLWVVPVHSGITYPFPRKAARRLSWYYGSSEIA